MIEAWFMIPVARNSSETVIIWFWQVADGRFFYFEQLNPWIVCVSMCIYVYTVFIDQIEAQRAVGIVLPQDCKIRVGVIDPIEASFYFYF